MGSALLLLSPGAAVPLYPPERRGEKSTLARLAASGPPLPLCRSAAPQLGCISEETKLINIHLLLKHHLPLELSLHRLR